MYIDEKTNKITYSDPEKTRKRGEEIADVLVKSLNKKVLEENTTPPKTDTAR